LQSQVLLAEFIDVHHLGVVLVEVAFLVVDESLKNFSRGRVGVCRTLIAEVAKSAQEKNQSRELGVMVAEF
jgi:hypothetical protein